MPCCWISCLQSHIAFDLPSVAQPFDDLIATASGLSCQWSAAEGLVASGLQDSWSDCRTRSAYMVRSASSSGVECLVTRSGSYRSEAGVYMLSADHTQSQSLHLSRFRAAR